MQHMSTGMLILKLSTYLSYKTDIIHNTSLPDNVKQATNYLKAPLNVASIFMSCLELWYDQQAVYESKNSVAKVSNSPIQCCNSFQTRNSVRHTLFNTKRINFEHNAITPVDGKTTKLFMLIKAKISGLINVC